MNYELQICILINGEEYSLGSLKLADQWTFDHYMELLDRNVLFTLWVEHPKDYFRYRNIIVDNSIQTRIESLPDLTRCVLVATDSMNVKLLTEDEYKDPEKIEKLIARISFQS